MTVGDVNKFPDQKHVYDKIFTDDVSDRITNEITFISLEGDTQPNDELWVSSLDACILRNDVSARVVVIPITVRPTDHFLVVASVKE